MFGTGTAECLYSRKPRNSGSHCLSQFNINLKNYKVFRLPAATSHEAYQTIICVIFMCHSFMLHILYIFLFSVSHCQVTVDLRLAEAVGMTVIQLSFVSLGLNSTFQHFWFTHP
jgi:hypothetical protein